MLLFPNNYNNKQGNSDVTEGADSVFVSPVIVKEELNGAEPKIE